MQNLLNNNRTGALITILVLAVGSISIVGVTHVAMASQIGKLCVIFACGNANITGGTSESQGGGGGQPTPNTATLIVIKKLNCEVSCRADQFKITVTGNNVLPETFDANTIGTKVTLDAGDYKISETAIGLPAPFKPSFSDDCTVNADGTTASGNINAGETQICTITNLVSPSLPH